MAFIVADHRENNGAIPHLRSCIAENNRANQKLSVAAGGGDIQYAEKQLPIGDYCVLIPSKFSTKNILAIVFERKTWKDLAASIKDGRSKGQQRGLDEIKRKRGCQVYFIVEGPLGYIDTHKIGNIPFKNLHAKLRHGLLRGYPYVQTKDTQGTAHLIVNFARDVMKLYAQSEIDFLDDLSEEYQNELNAVHEKYNKKLNLGNLSSLGNLGSSTEAVVITNSELTPQKIEETLNEIETINEDVDLETILNIRLMNGGDPNMPDELKSRRVQTDSDIIESMWESIPGVSNKTSPILMNKYRLSEIICAGSARVETLRKEIAELKYPSGTKIGDKRALKILEIAYDGDDIVKKEKSRVASVSLLACIPNITAVTAAAIIDKFSLREICNGQISSDDIANIKKAKNRRIGEKIAERIVDILQLSIVQ
jgi:ERCC4-type nuclease